MHGDGEAIAGDLYRQASYWALFALTPLEGASDRKPSFVSLWERAEPELLSRAAGSPEARDALRSALVDETFADFAELEKNERQDLTARLAAFTGALLELLRPERRRISRIWRLRLLRLGGLAFVFLTIGIVITRTLAWNDERRDLATRATWTTSSLALGGCRSPAQTCKESPGFFFHTQVESQPFVTFDLRRERSLSRAVVENRLDCCPERAVPLVLEVSSDQKSWKTIARRDEIFTTWRVSFPRVRARFVRLRLNGTGMLHLSRVQLLP